MPNASARDSPDAWVLIDADGGEATCGWASSGSSLGSATAGAAATDRDATDRVAASSNSSEVASRSSSYFSESDSVPALFGGGDDAQASDDDDDDAAQRANVVDDSPRLIIDEPASRCSSSEGSMSLSPCLSNENGLWSPRDEQLCEPVSPTRLEAQASDVGDENDNDHDSGGVDSLVGDSGQRDNGAEGSDASATEVAVGTDDNVADADPDADPAAATTAAAADNNGARAGSATSTALVVCAMRAADAADAEAGPPSPERPRCSADNNETASDTKHVTAPDPVSEPVSAACISADPRAGETETGREKVVNIHREDHHHQDDSSPGSFPATDGHAADSAVGVPAAGATDDATAAVKPAWPGRRECARFAAKTPASFAAGKVASSAPASMMMPQTAAGSGDSKQEEATAENRNGHIGAATAKTNASNEKTNTGKSVKVDPRKFPSGGNKTRKRFGVVSVFGRFSGFFFFFFFFLI
jgi:hypothetical protein